MCDLWVEIVDKTAKFVGKHGTSFESMLLEAEANNPKFSFLKAGNIHRSYYEQQIREAAAESNENVNINKPPVARDDFSQIIFEQPAQIQSQPPKRPVRQPPPDQYTVPHPYIPMADR